jgi:hypothetical protein
MRSSDFMDAIWKAYNLTSDYQLCKLTGWRSSRASNYRNHRSEFDDDTCLQVAELLHLDPLHVIASIIKSLNRELQRKQAEPQQWRLI